MITLAMAELASHGQNANAASDEQYTEVVIFDAEKDDPKAFLNATSPEDGDYLPQVKTATTAIGEKCLEFSYTGTEGQARSQLRCGKTVQELVLSGSRIVGAKFVIYYENEDFGNLNFLAHTATGGFNLAQALQKGRHEYLFLSGYGFGGAAKWPLLEVLSIWNNADNHFAKSFKLLKVVLLTLKEVKYAKELKVEYVRPIKEVLFSPAPLKADGTFIQDYQWGKLSEIKEFDYLQEGKGHPSASPVNANVGYNAENLFLRVEADYPTPPIAAVKENDLEVWQDEALELFLDYIQTDVHSIQFVINSEGVTYDWLYGFDTDAASVIQNLRWNLPHTKNISYANGKITYDLAFPWNKLNHEISKPPLFIGFQMVQNYIGRKSDNLFTMRWANTRERTKNTDANAFGFLVFNRKVFGTGSVKCEKIEKIPLSEPDRYDMYIKVALSGFTDGTYTVTHWLRSPDRTVSERSLQLALNGDRDLDFFLPNIKNLNGTYTWILGVKNKSGDTRLFGVNFNNEAELVDRFGEDIVWPRPKNIVWTENEFFNAGEKKLSALITMQASEPFLPLNYSTKNFSAIRGVSTESKEEFPKTLCFELPTE